jgi:hypothetical protein
VTFTATISGIAPASAVPAGNVIFFTNGTVFGAPVTLVGGVASISANLSSGTNSIAAAYLGNGNFAASTNNLTQIVSPAAASRPLTLSISRNDDSTVTVTFQGTPGTQYVVQASSDLSSPANWVNISTNLAGSNGVWTFTESVTNHPARFYRSGILDGARPLTVVQPVATPSTDKLQRNDNGTVTVFFSGTPFAQYIVQAASGLGSPMIWINVSTNTAGQHGRWTFTEEIGAQPQRFYRSAIP